MDEHVIKLKIREAYAEPKAPEALIQAVTLRAKAITMGTAAEKQLETAPAEKSAELAACALIGQLAAMSELPKGANPQQMAQQLQQQPEFSAALRGGNLTKRLHSGELMQQVAGQTPAQKAEPTQAPAPQKEGPAL